MSSVMLENDDGEVVAVVSAEPTMRDLVRPIRSCRSCGIGTYDELCSNCTPVAAPEKPKLSPAEESAAAFERERRRYA